jgi:hypothetical protein
MLSQLPKEILLNIFDKLTDNETLVSAYRLTNTCQSFHTLFSPHFIQQAAKKLLKHVLCDEVEKALHIISHRPECLFVELTVSPYQAILATENILLHDAAWSYINKMPNGYKLAVEHYQKQKQNPIQIAADFQKLGDIVTQEKFTKRKISEATYAAFQLFKNNFNTKFNESRFSCHLSLLLMARAVYDKHFSSWKVNQKTLYWTNVIGFLQRFVPACHVRLFGADKKSFFPLDPDLGEKFAIFEGKKSYWEWKLYPHLLNHWEVYINNHQLQWTKTISSLGLEPLKSESNATNNYHHTAP